MIGQAMALREVHDSSGFLFPLLFPFLFVGMWCFVCIIISRLGWSDWARIYRCDRELQGKSYRRRSGRFGFQSSYSGVLNVVLCTEGIGLSVMFPWRLGHPPLLLPWSKVVAVEEKNYFLFRQLRITLSDAGRTFSFELPLSAKPELDAQALGFRGPL